MEASKTVMVVDDEERMRSLLRTYLVREGYRVVTAGDGREALRLARTEKPDLIILDVMMPEMDGYEFLKRYRADGHTGAVIILTARVDEADAVLSLELGGDDYVAKPFSPRVLLARVKAVLRRASMNPPRGEVLRVADIALDRYNHQVSVRGKAVELTPSEFDLLGALMESPGRVYSRAELLEQVQGIAYEAYERTIDVHIKNLRTKIEPDPRHPRYIETVYGVGYRFAA